jgi:hypothetical protein
MEEMKNNVEEIKTENVSEEVKEETVEEQKDAIEDSENPLNKESLKNLTSMMRQAAEAVKMMRSVWESDMNEYDVSEDHIKELYQFNVQHRTLKEDFVATEEGEEYDEFNGLNEIQMEEVVRIFGEGHKIIGVDISQTIDRIKTVSGDFFAWVTMMRDYQQINDAYMMLLDLEEEKRIMELQKIANEESDQEQKEKMQNSLNIYYRNKYLDFLTDEISERNFKSIIDAFSNERKVEYWIKRTRDKLKQLKLSDKFILEISQFEKRFLEEKYHKASNILLLYFMNKIIYTDLYDKSNIVKAECVSMVLMLDKLVRNKVNEQDKERMLNNIKTLLDKFIDHLPEKKEEK